MSRILFHCTLTACVLALVSPLRAETPPSSVRDGAGLFSADAVRDANDAIEEIQRIYRKHVIVETFASPSRFKTWALKLKKPEDRGRFYDDWARELARKAGPDSFVILMCREPAPIHIAVAAGRDATRHGFSADACRSLKEKLRDPVARGAFDGSLRDAIASVRETLDANRLKGAMADDAFPWAGILFVLVALLSVWLFLISVRRIQIMKAGAASQDELAGLANSGSVSYLANLFAGMNTPWIPALVRGWREDALHERQLVAPPADLADPTASSPEDREKWSEIAPPGSALDASHTR